MGIGKLLPAGRRLLLVSIACICTAGCHYMLDVAPTTNQPQQPTIPAPPDGVVSSDYYVSVIASAARTAAGSPASVCSHPYVLTPFGTQNDAISLSAVVSNSSGDAAPIPLYTANSNTPNNTCDVSYDLRYVLPSVHVEDHELLTIKDKAYYQTTGTSSISQLVTNGLGLVGSFSPAGRTLSTASSIVASPFTTNFQANIASSVLSATTSIGDVLVSLNVDDNSNNIPQVKSYDILRIPLNWWDRSPQPDKAEKLGTLTLVVQQSLTVIGTEPAAGKSYPTYFEMTASSSVYFFPNTSSTDLQTLLNNGANSGRIDAVQNLKATDSPGVVGNACRALDNAMVAIHLNRLDRAAFLLKTYGTSDNAAKNENINSATSPCLNPDQQHLVKVMDLGWMLPPQS